MNSAQGGLAKPPRLSLRLNFSWTFVGQSIYSACQWGMLIVVAQLGSPESVGRFALGFAITTPVFMLSNLNLSAAQATDTRDEYSFGHYLGLRLVMTSLSFVPIALWMVLGGYEWSTVKVVVLVAAAKSIEAVADVFWGLFQRHERMDLVARSMILKGIGSLALFSVLMFLFRSLDIAILGLIAAWLAVLLLYDLRNGARFTSLSPSFPFRRLAALAWLVLPLGIVGGLNSFSAEMPRYFLAFFHGEKDLGLYAATAALAMVARLVVTALSRSAVPRMAQLFAAGDIAGFKRLLGKLTLVGLAVGAAGVLVAILLGRWILGLLYGPEYESQSWVLVWVMAGVAVLTTATFLGTGMTAARRFKVQAAIHSLKILVMATACLALIPTSGTLGAAWAVLAGTVVSALAYFLVLNRMLARVVESKRC